MGILLEERRLRYDDELRARDVTGCAGEVEVAKDRVGRVARAR